MGFRCMVTAVARGEEVLYPDLSGVQCERWPGAAGINPGARGVGNAAASRACAPTESAAEITVADRLAWRAGGGEHAGGAEWLFAAAGWSA